MKKGELKPRALYYDVLTYDEDSISLLEDNFDMVRLASPDEDSDEVLADVQVLFAPLGYDLGRQKIDRCPKLEVIASSTTGAPHIDLAYARAKGIYVAYLGPEVDFLKTITATAEHTWGLMLALIRRVPWAFDDVKAGRWYRFRWPAPEMLSRMSLGIVGLGRLGTMVARYGVAFGMNVQYYDPYVDSSPIAGVLRAQDLVAMVAQCDVVTIHAHATSETIDLIDADVLKQFRDGAYLINTARGAIVNRDALLDALKSGKLGGAALDVLEDEYDKDFNKSVYDHPLVQYSRSHGNLIITPHIAGSTLSSWKLTRQHTIEMVIRYFNSRSGNRSGQRVV